MPSTGTLALAITRLIDSDGRIVFLGKDLNQLNESELEKIILLY